jgi:hypothetical protein
VTGVSCGLVFFFVAWCVDAGLAVAVWLSVAATGEALPVCLAFPPPVALPITPRMTINAARLPSAVRTLCRRSRDLRGGCP